MESVKNTDRLKKSIKKSLSDAKNSFNSGVKKKDKKKSDLPMNVRVFNFIKRWLLRLFYTLFFVAFSYVFILSCITVLPMSLGYLLGATGYTLSNNAEILLMFLTGLFVIAWVFTISKFVIKKVLAIYVRAMKKTISKEFLEKLKDNADDVKIDSE